MTVSEIGTKNIEDTVVKGGYCVGCGACAALSPTRYRMEFSDMGTYLPTPINSDANFQENPADLVCPFSAAANNETLLGEKLYPSAPNVDKKIGRYISVQVGAANAGNYRQKGSSGGLTNWILSKLLESGEVDGVIGVGENTEKGKGDPLFKYQIARSVDEISRFSKSKYYPIEISEVIQQIREKPGRYAIVGVPCFIKAIRNISLVDADIGASIRYAISIVCGHLKSAGFAESLAWQVGVEPNDLARIDFRVKVPGASANRYAIKAEGMHAGKPVEGSKQVFDLYGTDWGLGFFKLKGCDYCDDIAGETADVTLGDAWLPNEVKDWRGTNILIVRHPVIASILEEGCSSGEIVLRKSDRDEFVKSQGANYRHRHDGLAVRLSAADRKNIWRPLKRIDADLSAINKKRQKIMYSRSILAELSHIAHHEAKAKNSIGVFYQKMRFHVYGYYLASGSFVKFLVKSFYIYLRKFKN